MRNGSVEVIVPLVPVRGAGCATGIKFTMSIDGTCLLSLSSVIFCDKLYYIDGPNTQRRMSVTVPLTVLFKVHPQTPRYDIRDQVPCHVFFAAVCCLVDDPFTSTASVKELLLPGSIDASQKKVNVRREQAGIEGRREGLNAR